MNPLRPHPSPGADFVVRRTRVKICGITNPVDMRLAVDAGADALGFIHFEKSPRHLDLFQAEWIAEAPAFVTRTAVLVNPTEDLLRDIAALRLFNAVQLHGHEGSESIEAARALGFRVIKAFRPHSEADYAATRALEPDLLLADTPDGDKLGGSGKTGNWLLAAEQAAIQRVPPLLLSGGLNPVNVEAAIRAVRPYGVDVSSGLEASPGKKDAALLEGFFRAVHRADATFSSGEISRNEILE